MTMFRMNKEKNQQKEKENRTKQLKKQQSEEQLTGDDLICIG